MKKHKVIVFTIINLLNNIATSSNNTESEVIVLEAEPNQYFQDPNTKKLYSSIQYTIKPNPWVPTPTKPEHLNREKALKEFLQQQKNDSIKRQQEENDYQSIKRLKQQELNLQLIESFKENNIERMNQVLNEGADINSKISDSYSFLLYATLNQDLAMIKALIAMGADIQDFINNSYLALSFCIDNPKILQELIDIGLDVNAPDTESEPLLELAIKENNIDSIKVLLKAGIIIPKRLETDQLIQEAQKEITQEKQSKHNAILTYLQSQKRKNNMLTLKLHQMLGV